MSSNYYYPLKRYSGFLSFILLYAVSVFACASVQGDVYEIEDMNGSVPVTVERGAILVDGSDDAGMANYERWVRSAYFIETKGAKTFKMPNIHDGQCYVWQYNEEHRVISSDEMTGYVNLANTCKYIRFQINATNTPEHVQVLLEGGDESLTEKKKVQISFPYDRLVYGVNEDMYTTALLMLPPNYTVDGDSVPLIIWDSGDGSFRDWDRYEGGNDEGRLTGLRYLRDQGFAVLEIYSWGSDHYKKHLGCGDRSAMPIPSHLATHEKGVEYVTSRYNIDPDKVFEVSKSGSGKISLYWAMYRPQFNLNAIYAFAPVFDDLNFVGWGMEGYRYALYEELNLQGTEDETRFFLEGEPYDYDLEYKMKNNLDIKLVKSWQMHKSLGRSFIERNAEKFKMVSVNWMGLEGISLSQLAADTHTYSAIFWDGYNRHYDAGKNRFIFSWDNNSMPAIHSNCYTRYDLKRINSGIPFTVIMSPTDEQTPYWNALEVVKQLQNGGADAKMITLEDGGHSGPDLSTCGPNVVSDVTTRLGIHYDYVSIGWYLAVEDIYNRFLKTSDTESNQNHHSL